MHHRKNGVHMAIQISPTGNINIKQIGSPDKIRAVVELNSKPLIFHAPMAQEASVEMLAVFSQRCLDICSK